ncbi:MAG: hypothetical protein MUE37_14205 [Bacteroidales bacterium]|jgi:hypothetical protein|nr:hypothetical protein [Bacteroidales bacterium]
MKNSCKWLCSSTTLVLIFFLISLCALKGQGNGISEPGTEESGGIEWQVAGDATIPTGSKCSEDTCEIQLTALKDMAGARVWWSAWLAGYSAATAGQAIVFFSSDDRTLRQDMALGAATTFLGAMNQLITPIEPKPRDYPAYREYVSGEMPLSSDQAAELLRKLAAWEKEGRSWKTHALAGAVNLGSGLITWLGFRRTIWAGVANFALNTAVTEAQIWTQPMKAVRDYERFTRGAGQGTESLTSRRVGEWSWSIHTGGFYVRYVF